MKHILIRRTTSMGCEFYIKKENFLFNSSFQPIFIDDSGYQVKEINSAWFKSRDSVITIRKLGLYTVVLQHRKVLARIRLNYKTVEMPQCVFS